MKTKKITYTLFSLFALILVISAQEKTFVGKVTTYELLPVNKAEIFIKKN